MIYCFVGKTGVGKDTIAKEISHRLNLPILVTHTTRPMRNNEVDHVDYHFVDDDFFNREIDNFIETREYKVYDGSIWTYGLHQDSIKDESLVVLDASGCEELINYVGEDNVVVFYVDVAEEEILKRVKERGDEIAEVNRRLKDDKEKFKDFLRYNNPFIIVNNNFGSAVNTVMSIIRRV